MDASRQEDAFDQSWETLERLSRRLEQLTPADWSESGFANAVDDLTRLVAWCHSIGETSGATLSTALLSAVEVACKHPGSPWPGDESVATWGRAVAALRRALETYEATGACEDRPAPELLTSLTPAPVQHSASSPLGYEEEVVEQPAHGSVPVAVARDYPLAAAPVTADEQAECEMAVVEEALIAEDEAEDDMAIIDDTADGIPGSDDVADVGAAGNDPESVRLPFPVVSDAAQHEESEHAHEDSPLDEPAAQATADEPADQCASAVVDSLAEDSGPTEETGLKDTSRDGSTVEEAAQDDSGEPVENFILPIVRSSEDAARQRAAEAPAPTTGPASVTTTAGRIPTSAVLLVNLADDSQRALPLCDVLRVARVPWSTIVEEQHGRSAWISGVRIPVVELTPADSFRHRTDPQSVVVAIGEQRRVGLCVATVGPILADTGYQPALAGTGNQQQTIDVNDTEVAIVTADYLLRLANGESLPGAASSPRVLLIHPSEFHRRVTAMSLRSAEFVVTTASDLTAAVEKLEQDGPFHVVAADLAVAAPDGFRFGSWLRAQTDGSVVTVALSDLVGSGASAIARHAGFDRCLHAGDVDELVELVHRICCESDLPRAASA